MFNSESYLVGLTLIDCEVSAGNIQQTPMWVYKIRGDSYYAMSQDVALEAIEEALGGRQ
jgi:hypothetical protein